MKRISTDIFNIVIEQRKPYSGALLVAEPFLSESYFKHSVVCLVDYNERDGGLGLVMNHLTHYRMPDILPQVVRTDATQAIPVFCGGPMSEDRLFYIHTLGPEIISNSSELTPGVYVGGSFEDALDYINSGYPTEGKIRFFVGYSGWGSGQLEEEIKANTWAVTEMPDKGLLDGSKDGYWHKTVRGMGRKYRGWLYHPEDIHAN